MRWTIPLSDGTMEWDGQWDTHASVEGQVDIPWNVPLSHGTVGWDGQFTEFLDIYDKIYMLQSAMGVHSLMKEPS